MAEENKVSRALEGAATPTEGGAKHKAASRSYNVSVYIGPERRSKIDRLRADWNLNGSQVVRLLLDYALAAEDAGKLKPERETITRAKAPKP